MAGRKTGRRPRSDSPAAASQGNPKRRRGATAGSRARAPPDHHGAAASSEKSTQGRDSLVDLDDTLLPAATTKALTPETPGGGHAPSPTTAQIMSQISEGRHATPPTAATAAAAAASTPHQEPTPAPSVELEQQQQDPAEPGRQRQATARAPSVIPTIFQQPEFLSGLQGPESLAARLLSRQPKPLEAEYNRLDRDFKTRYGLEPSLMCRESSVRPSPFLCMIEAQQDHLRRLERRVTERRPYVQATTMALASVTGMSGRLQVSDSTTPEERQRYLELSKEPELPTFYPPLMDQNGGDLRRTLRYWAKRYGASVLKVKRAVFSDARPAPATTTNNNNSSNEAGVGECIQALFEEDGPLFVTKLGIPDNNGDVQPWICLDLHQPLLGGQTALPADMQDQPMAWTVMAMPAEGLEQSELRQVLIRSRSAVEGDAQGQGGRQRRQGLSRPEEEEEEEDCEAGVALDFVACRGGLPAVQFSSKNIVPRETDPTTGEFLHLPDLPPYPSGGSANGHTANLAAATVPGEEGSPWNLRARQARWRQLLASRMREEREHWDHIRQLMGKGRLALRVLATEGAWDEYRGARAEQQRHMELIRGVLDPWQVRVLQMGIRETTTTTTTTTTPRPAAATTPESPPPFPFPGQAAEPTSPAAAKLARKQRPAVQQGIVRRRSGLRNETRLV